VKQERGSSVPGPSQSQPLTANRQPPPCTLASLREYADGLLRELCARYPMGYVPLLQWKGLRVSAGMAYYRAGKIALSTRILHDEPAVRDTLVHEYAHLLAVHRYGKRGAGHGPGWQQAMREMGQEPKVRHNYHVERNERRQSVTYKCARCSKLFVRGKRFPRGHRYLHVDCGGELRLVLVQPAGATITNPGNTT
jgi:predicted SprT family Zn-dependent metalloprotease